jgi:hypothetical protein
VFFLSLSLHGLLDVPPGNGPNNACLSGGFLGLDPDMLTRESELIGNLFYKAQRAIVELFLVAK